MKSRVDTPSPFLSLYCQFSIDKAQYFLLSSNVGTLNVPVIFLQEDIQIIGVDTITITAKRNNGKLIRKVP